MELPMIRTLILSFAILAMGSAPAQAHGGGHGSHGGGHGSHGGGQGHSGHHHHHFHHFSVFPFGVFLIDPFFTQFPYAYPCWWEEGHWEDQIYGDKLGNYTYLPEWVPGRWKCPDSEVDDALGTARQGYGLSLARFANEGWRATFCVTGREHSATRATCSAWKPA